MGYYVLPAIILLVITAWLMYRAYAGRLRNGVRKDPANDI